MLAQPKHLHVPTELNWPLINKLNSIQLLDTKEIVRLRKLHEKTFAIKKHQDLSIQENLKYQYIIINQGWACRYSILSNGSRQIIKYYLPGDIINPLQLHATQANHFISSITPLYVSAFTQEALQRLLTFYPKLDSLYKQMICADEAILAEQVVRIGRRSAYEGTIHLLVELFKRLSSIGHINQNSFKMPITQELLADTLGMSPVHMNRTLTRLRKEGLIEIQANNKICLLDLPKLEQLAEYQGVLLDTKKRATQY